MLCRALVAVAFCTTSTPRGYASQGKDALLHGWLPARTRCLTDTDMTSNNHHCVVLAVCMLTSTDGGAHAVCRVRTHDNVCISCLKQAQHASCILHHSIVISVQL